MPSKHSAAMMAMAGRCAAGMCTGVQVERSPTRSGKSSPRLASATWSAPLAGQPPALAPPTSRP
eukprot:1557375-Lingulodinium_polyedra.AAC.1